MSEMVEQNFWLSDRCEGRRFAIALAAGLALELGVLAVALPVLTHQRAPSDRQSEVVKLSIIAPAPAPPAPPPPKPLPKVPPPKPVITPPPLPPPPPLPVAPPIPLPVIPMQPSHFTRHVEHVRHVPPPPVTPPPVQHTPPTPAPPPAPVVIPQPSAGEIDMFQAEMAAAVQRAANADYPQAAQMARENGEVFLDFTFLDGAVSDIILERSSGFPLLDEAAVQAVHDAAYPAEPADFAGRSHNVRVVVRFHTAAVDTDAD